MSLIHRYLKKGKKMIIKQFRRLKVLKSQAATLPMVEGMK